MTRKPSIITNKSPFFGWRIHCKLELLRKCDCVSLYLTILMYDADHHVWTRNQLKSNKQVGVDRVHCMVFCTGSGCYLTKVSQYFSKGHLTPEIETVPCFSSDILRYFMGLQKAIEQINDQNSLTANRNGWLQDEIFLVLFLRVFTPFPSTCI